MVGRHEVHPHHVLRAVLADRYAREVLAAVDLAADDLLLTLEHLWLDASDTIDLEEIEVGPLAADDLVALMNPPYDGSFDRDRLSESARDLLVTALATRGQMGHRETTSGHLLVAVLRSHQRLLAGVVREHRVPVREVTRVVERWGRRAP